MIFKLLLRRPLRRTFFVVLTALWLVPCFSQNAFTDGLSWVSFSPSTTAQSPVFSSPACQDIQYTISTTSSLAFEYNPTAVNGSGVLFPSYSNNAGNTMNITISFNVPVSNFGMRILDLDEDNQQNQGPAEETLSTISPAPSSVSALGGGINPIFLAGTTVTPDDNNSANNNNNAGGWVYFPGQVTTINFTYNRYDSGYEFVLDSLHFECPCPTPGNHIDDASICPEQPDVLDATTPNATAYLWNTGSTASAIQTDIPGTYWVNVYLGSCLESDTAVISLIPTPNIDFGNDTVLCEGQSLALTVNPQVSPVTWQDGSSVASYIAASSGTYYASANYNGCPLSDTIVLTVMDYPVVDLGPDAFICEGNSFILTAPSGYTYVWSNGSTAPEEEFSGGGTFWVRVSNGSCAASDTILVTGKPLPVNPLSGDTIICMGDAATFTLSTTNGSSYEWFNGSTENTITLSAAGSYWVESSFNGCSRIDTLKISEYPSIAGLVFDSVVVVCEDKSALIGPALSSELIDVLWDNGSTHSTIYVNGEGTHYFTVSTPCESATYSVRVEEEKCFCTVYLPNAFTPDNKFGNETFAPVYECALDRYELLIFNRWGETVFSATDPNAAWDGTFRGLPVPDGVYVYKLTYTSPEMEAYKELTGHVSVLR